MDRLVIVFVATVCAFPAAAQPARSYNYTLEYGLSPANVSEVQRRHQAVCMQIGPARCRVNSSRITESHDGQGAITFEVSRSIVPQVLERFVRVVDDAGGQARLRGLQVTEATGSSRPDEKVSIAIAYVGIPGFAQQAGEALRGSGSVAKAALLTMIALLPALAPWLVTAALIAWGVKSAWRGRRRPHK